MSIWARRSRHLLERCVCIGNVRSSRSGVNPSTEKGVFLNDGVLDHFPGSHDIFPLSSYRSLGFSWNASPRTIANESNRSVLSREFRVPESSSTQSRAYSLRASNAAIPKETIPIQTSIRNFSTRLRTEQSNLGRAFTGSFSRPELQSQRVIANRSRTTLLYLSALVIAMLGLTYASVPLYRMFCQATGFGGTVKRLETVEDKIARNEDSDLLKIANKRELTVQFNADVADGMPWKFIPTQREVKVKPGQSTLAFYTAHNLSNEPITGVSTYNVTPAKAGTYFNKIQCFCFEEQRLQPGEKIDMPVFFYIDPEFASDPKMKDVNYMTLSYTFFKVDKE